VATPEKVLVTIRNKGTRSGREVIQVYAMKDERDRPNRWLAGFAVVEAGAGEVVTTEIALPARTFEQWNDGWQRVSGDYALHAGRSIGDLRISAVVSIT
jgi:beta-glucosidase